MKKKILIPIILAILIIVVILTIFFLNKKNDSISNDKSNNNVIAKNETESSEVNYTTFKDTDIPSIESVLGYEKPFIDNDMWEDDNYYYASYTYADMKGFNSNVKNPEDYNKYSSILIEKGYSLENESTDEDNAKIYTYKNGEIKITLRVLDKSIEITIEK